MLADGELTAREAERVVWDVIVVGTGMGGGMLGYSLARSGRRVLFVEKGRSTLPGTPGTIRSAMPELAEPQAVPFGRDLLRRPGPRRTHHRRDRRHQRALPEAVRAVHRQRHRRILGPVRHGLRTILRPRFHPPAKLRRPRRFHRARGLADHLRPDAVPGTPRPKSCSGSAASPIPCARRPPRSVCPPHRRFRPTTSRWSTI